MRTATKGPGLRHSAARVLTIAMACMLAAAGFAAADNVQNDVSVENPAEIEAGGSVNVNYWINSTGGSCNVDDDHPAVVTINLPADVTAVPDELTFTACGNVNTNTQTVAFSSNVVGAHAIPNAAVSQENPQGNGFNVNPSSFTLTVTEAASALTAPVLTLPDDFTVVANAVDGGIVGRFVEYEASAEDEDGPVDVDCIPASGSFFGLGTTTVECSATNEAGTTEGSFDVTVVLEFGDWLPPYANSPRVKKGSTLPVKFNLTGESAAIQESGVFCFTLALVGGGGEAGEDFSSPGNSDSGNCFRYVEEDDQYHYNLKIGGTAGQKYEVRITDVYQDGDALPYFQVR